MWKKAFPVLLLCVLIGGLLAGCGETKNEEPFPSEDVFTSEIRDISVQELQDGGYQLEIETVLRNNSEKAYEITGNPTCWNVLYINGEREAQDLPAGSYTLQPGGELKETKNINLTAEELKTCELYVVSEFSIAHADGTSQSYAIRSESREVDL